MVVRYIRRRLRRSRIVYAVLLLAAASIILLRESMSTKKPGQIPHLTMTLTRQLESENSAISTKRKHEVEHDKDVIKILFALCRSENESALLLSLSRQLTQTETLLKSAVYLSTMNIRFYVVCSSPEIFDKVLALTNTWPPQMLRKVAFKYLPTWFPTRMQHLRDVFRPCSTQRLFIDHLLPTEDAVIYMDTDIIFLRSPDLLWMEFQHFNSSHMVSAAMPTLMFRNDPQVSKVIDFSSVGFNAGVLLLNLTRLRNFSGGFQDTVIQVMSDHSDIILSDQDTMNYIFNKSPQYFRELQCPWNFRWPLCQHVRQRCALLLALGAYAVHGLGGSFLSKHHPVMRVQLCSKLDVFLVKRPIMEMKSGSSCIEKLTIRPLWWIDQVEFHTQWSILNFTVPLSEFVHTLEDSLMKKNAGVSLCSHFKYMSQILLQQLKTQLLQDQLL